ncbi:MAG: YkvA family protein [Patescibacteria group bacterium]
MNLLKFYRNGLKNPNTRWAFILFTFLYLLSPIDLIFDFIPFFGQIDDIALIFVFITEMFKILVLRKPKKERKKSFVDVAYKSKS